MTIKKIAKARVVLYKLSLTVVIRISAIGVQRHILTRHVCQTFKDPSHDMPLQEVKPTQ